jgi:hypothetical protein
MLHRKNGPLAGGEWAAAIATAHLRPARAALHFPRADAAKWMGILKLVPDPAGDVDLISTFGDGNQWTNPPSPLRGIPCANPVLIYGELLSQGPMTGCARPPTFFCGSSSPRDGRKRHDRKP